MVSIVSLWLPIILSAVFVFVLSSVMHMMLPLHRNDFRTLPSEDAVMDALRPFDIPPGDYMMPRAGSPEAMRSASFKAKIARGPVAVITFYPSGPFNMGASLAQWFAYSLLVGVFAAYVTSRALGHGVGYLPVFRFAGATAFMCYALALAQDSIWYRRNWGTTLRYGLDGLVYALVTAGTFGWLWPK